MGGVSFGNFPLLFRPAAPVRINWAALNASRAEFEAEKWAGKLIAFCLTCTCGLAEMPQ